MAQSMAKKPKYPNIQEAGDALAYLLLAAQEDPGFKEQLLGVLRIPGAMRDLVITQAVAEMKAKGEDPAICAAFALLAADEIASTAIQRLSA